MKNDRDWAHALYEAFARAGDDESLWYLEIDGAPWSKSRPRFARGRVYSKRDDVLAERALRYRMMQGKAPKFPGNVMVACRFYRPNFQRIDADNLLKHVCDSANGVLWEDDSQVTLVFGEVHHDAENPRTVILVANHHSTLVRGADAHRTCLSCAKPFKPAFTGSKARFCSKACSHNARATRLEEKVCAQCSATFKPTTKEQILCGRACSIVYMRGRQQPGLPPIGCSDCGKPLKHRRGGRCRECWRKNPGFYGPRKSA